MLLKERLKEGYKLSDEKTRKTMQAAAG